MAMRIIATLLFVACSSPAYALDFENLVNDYIQDRRENIYETVKSFQNAVKDYQVNQGEAPESVEQLIEAGYLPEGFEQDRFFGRIEIQSKKLNDSELKAYFVQVKPRGRYKNIVDEALKGFGTCKSALLKEGEVNNCQTSSDRSAREEGERASPINIMARDPRQEATISEATVDLMRQSLERSIDSMVESWGGKKAEVNEDFVVLTARDPEHLYEFRSLNEESLDRSTYIGGMFVLEHRKPAPDGSEQVYERSYTIPPVKRFNPMSNKRHTLMVFEGGDYLYVTPVNNGREGTGLRLEWDHSQNSNIIPGSGSHIKIARMILWTPSEDEGVETIGGEEDDG